MTDDDEAWIGRLAGEFDLPSRPDVLLTVSRLLNGFAPDLYQILRIVRQDAALSARTLHQANRGSRRVASIEEAGLMLGLMGMRRVVDRLFLKAKLIGRDNGLHEIRLRAVQAGVLSRYVALSLPALSPNCSNGYLPVVEPEEAYTLGLFHDCGIPAMMNWFSDYYPLYQTTHASGGRLLAQAEQERFGIDHGRISFLLCRSWHFPKAICRVIREHHTIEQLIVPGQRTRRRKTAILQAILHLAERLGQEMPDHEWQVLQAEIFRFLAIGDHEWSQLQRNAPVMSFDERAAR
ncbi:MAG: HDOD domain-containing protein [Magnetococcales bacterium]|nr:HDOD domain-containing protein [Magnetococcales bacterium]